MNFKNFKGVTVENSSGIMYLKFPYGRATLLDNRKPSFKRDMEPIKGKADKIIGKYDVIVVDPPWPMTKIKRRVAPNQVGFDYSTMPIDEIQQLVILSYQPDNDIEQPA